jgi:hypothetical protein
VVAAGEPFNQVMAGVAGEAGHLTELREALRSQGWQSEVEERGIPRIELEYNANDGLFVRDLGPFLLQTHRWAGRLVDFVSDPWAKIQSAPEAKERLRILAEELASCGEKARQASESAPPAESARIDRLAACMDQVGRGIHLLDERGNTGSHDYLTQQVSAFLYQWENMIIFCQNLS